MKKTALFAALLCLAQSPLHAVVPSLISYQGHVTDAAGNIGESAPVNRTITFRIWNSATAIADANRLYAEKMVVTINKGDFSVLLGQGTSTGETMTYANLDGTGLFNGNDVYLGITVDDGNSGTVDAEITPRQRIVSSAFAMRSRVAESVDGQAITNGMLANNAVDTTQIAGNAVTAAKIAASAVGSSQIADGSIATADIATDTILAGNIAAGAVGTSEILDGTVATADIANLAVTTAKIATDTILAGNIAAGAVGTSEILDGNVTTADIGALAVTNAKIATDTILAGNIAADAVGTSEIANGSVTGTDIAAATITSNNLGTGTATTVENLRMIRGTVRSDGVRLYGAGFTVVKVAGQTGLYQINFSTAFSSVPSVYAGLIMRGNFKPYVCPGGLTIHPIFGTDNQTPSSNGFTVSMLDNNGTNAYDRGFQFIAIGPR
ncbi:MAG: hypothetical protein RLZZ245_1423 [Verrucomicrobiota bacterium]|jgi:hypothetical protein